MGLWPRSFQAMERGQSHVSPTPAPGLECNARELLSRNKFLTCVSPFECKNDLETSGFRPIWLRFGNERGHRGWWTFVASTVESLWYQWVSTRSKKVDRRRREVLLRCKRRTLRTEDDRLPRDGGVVTRKAVRLPAPDSEPRDRNLLRKQPACADG